MTLLLRVILVVAFSAIVLAIAYVVVTDPGSGTDVIARGHRPPVQADVGPAVKLGRGHAVMASGPAGLWVARQPQTGPPGVLERIDTSTGRPEHAYQIKILPQGIAVGQGVIWVLGTAPNARPGHTASDRSVQRPRPAPPAAGRAAVMRHP